MTTPLYLVTGKVEVSYYMSSGRPNVTVETRLVVAEDEDEAVKKFEAHFNAKTDEYSVYYSVSNVEAYPTIY